MQKILLIRNTRNIKGLVFSSIHCVYEAMHSGDAVSKNEQFMVLKAKKGWIKKVILPSILSLAHEFFGCFGVGGLVDMGSPGLSMWWIWYVLSPIWSPTGLCKKKKEISWSKQSVYLNKKDWLQQKLLVKIRNKLLGSARDKIKN